MKPLRILIADSRKHARGSLKALLTASLAAIEVWEASTGPAAVAVAAVARPQLVVLDVDLPDLDGPAAAREIRRLWPKTRILFLTLDDGREQEARAAGADAFVTKAEPPQRLLAALHSLL